MLIAEGLSKSFAGLTVIRDVSFTVRQGTIHSIIGPNGAGKTTLINMICGLYKPDKGEIFFRSRSLAGKQPYEITRLGISRTFQNIRLFAEMSVAENIWVGQSAQVPIGLRSLLPGPRKRSAALREQLESLLELTNLADKRHMKAKHLPYGDQRRLEIARALAAGADLLILDEPAAGMNPEESAALSALISRIRAGGKTVLLVEHDMSVVMNISDTVTVINFGEKMAEGTPAEIKGNALVREAYLGRENEDE